MSGKDNFPECRGGRVNSVICTKPSRVLLFVRLYKICCEPLSNWREEDSSGAHRGGVSYRLELVQSQVRWGIWCSFTIGSKRDVFN